VSVYGPYPCFVTIATDRGEIRMHHKELADLAYAVAWAQREARSKLPKNDRHEVQV
jgi:hypothetical protein